MTEAIYEGIFNEGGGYPDREAGLPRMLGEFEITEADLKGAEVLYACYEYEDYTGDSFVLLRGTDGELLEVTGSHCSCRGLEGQWEPTRTTKEAILMRDNVRPTLRALLEAMP